MSTFSRTLKLSDYLSPCCQADAYILLWGEIVCRQCKEYTGYILDKRGDIVEDKLQPKDVFF